MNTVTLDSEINRGNIKLGRGNIISSIDIARNPGDYPIYSSSAKGTGEFGRYGDYMFDEELITWSVDGGGRFFFRPKHKFSVTNVSGFMRIDPDIWDRRFVYCSLDFQHQRITFDYQTKAHPSVIRHLYRLTEFPKPEQSKIAEVISKVDQAIEQTESLIAKQQRIKTGLMQDLLTRGIDEHGNLRSEETHEFKDSPLGRIPVEWEVRKLCELANVERGKFTHRPRDDARFYGGVFPFIQTGDITSRIGRTVNSYTQTLSIKGTKVSKEFPKGTIAITIAANIADTAFLGQPMYFPDSVVGAIVFEPFSIRYVELAIRRWKPILERMAPQSAQRNINLEVLRPLLIATPAPEEQIQIADIYERAEFEQIQIENSRDKLRSLKTALMQDLLTGKKRVTPLLEKTEVHS